MDWNKAFPDTNFNFEDEDVRLEKTVKTLTKSPEEIAKLTIDESLSDIDRAQLLITTGQEVQQICAINQLPCLLEHYNVDAMCRVVPQLMDILKSASSAVNEAAANSFVTAVKKELVPSHLYITSFLPSILKGIESRDVSINKIWMMVLLESISCLTKEIIKGDVVSIALAKGQLSQTVASRLASCRIIGQVCASKKVDVYWIKQDLLPLATSLCQDVDFEVRSCMCHQLDPIARSLGFSLSKSCILHELIELSRDEESSVRIASLETMVDLLDFFDKNYIKDTIVPLFHKFFDQSFTNQDDCFKAVAFQIGRICDLLKGHLDDNEKLWFIHFYCKTVNATLSDNKESTALATSTPVSCVSLSPTNDDMESELRHYCAYNIPAMVMFHGKEKFSRDLLGILNKLAADDNLSVRQSIAHGIHEVAAILRCDAMKIASLYIKLMKDKSLTTLEGLIEHLPQAMLEFANAANLSVTTKAPGLTEFIPGLLAMEQTCAKNNCKWRLHSDLLKQFSCLVHCLTSDQIYSKFVPLLFRYVCSSCVLPVKHAASQTLCMIIRNNRKQEQREELCHRIIEECAHSNKHKLRLLYVDICKFVLELFSKSFFKQHFCESLLELAGDPVPNVRLSVSYLLPNVKRSLKLPSDRVLLQQLDQTVRKLYSLEHDTDVSHTVRLTLPELNRIEVAVETLSRKTTFMEEDLLDQKKEQEEKLLLLAEEQEAKEPDNSSKGKQSATSKDKQKNPPTKRFTSPLRTTSSANTTPTSTRRAMSPPASGLSNSLTSTLPSPSTTGPSTSAGGSSGSGGTSPAVIKKAVTIPKIVTPVSGSPGLQKRETFHGSTRGTKTPVPSETKSQPSLDTKGLTSSPRSSPSELRKTKPKDDKVSTRSAPSTSKRKPLSSGGRGTKRT
ncbi:serine/threonine-protein phosphatase 4 regulatory subunit 4-like isoform X2 [Dysidea avara]|uniref:serine/threonine-protein phosphatase 4 regulatory subunit 4-like isoform X2 n=1 Tax=Dysidea avara TaxID=196820 RepID=UPI003318E420